MGAGFVRSPFQTPLPDLPLSSRRRQLDRRRGIREPPDRPVPCARGPIWMCVRVCVRGEVRKRVHPDRSRVSLFPGVPPRSIAFRGPRRRPTRGGRGGGAARACPRVCSARRSEDVDALGNGAQEPTLRRRRPWGPSDCPCPPASPQDGTERSGADTVLTTSPREPVTDPREGTPVSLLENEPRTLVGWHFVTLTRRREPDHVFRRNGWPCGVKRLLLLIF